MSDPEERSESGAPVYRYDAQEAKDFSLAAGDDVAIEAISEHIEAHIGPIHKVWHELISDQVHIDIHWVLPSEELPFNVLVTSGMSDLPMTVPEGLDGLAFAELVLCLPEDWKMDQEDWEDEANYWPIRWMKILARFPHQYSTWLGYGHTIPNGDPPQPFAPNTKLCGMLLMPAISFGESFWMLPLSEQKTINFYSLLPLYEEEMDYKLKNGVDALMEKFDQFFVNDEVDIDRENTCKKKGFFGGWGKK